MTIKRYTFDQYYDSEECPVDTFEECEFGEYCCTEQVLRRLEDMLSSCLYTPEALPLQIRTLIEELQ